MTPRQLGRLKQTYTLRANTAFKNRDDSIARARRYRDNGWMELVRCAVDVARADNAAGREYLRLRASLNSRRRAQ